MLDITRFLNAVSHRPIKSKLGHNHTATRANLATGSNRLRQTHEKKDGRTS
jgi:hypothetical protein